MMRAALLIAVMSAVTIALRFLPFLIFRRETPPYVAYLGKVLPPAVIGMLVVYCLRNTAITAFPFGLPEIISAISVVAMQVWRRNSLVSILTGTIIYMALTQFII